MSSTVDTDAPTSTQLPSGFPDPRLARRYESVLELIGNTPLVRLNRVTEGIAPAIYVKLDHYNLGGSSKDRIGLNIVREAIADGSLPADGRILDGGQGNTNIGYQLAALYTGHPVTSLVTAAVSPTKRQLLRFLGSVIEETDYELPDEDPRSPVGLREAIQAADPSAWFANQKDVWSNPVSHYHSTGPEIWHQTEGKVTHFVAAIATGGTVSGTGKFLHEQNPDIHVTGTGFVESPNYEKRNLKRVWDKVPGWEELEVDYPKNIDLSQLNALEFRKREEVIDLAWRLARTEGLLLGLTSVLSLLVALEQAAEAGPDDLFVVFSADSGRDYLSREYNADWLRENELGHIADKYEGPRAEAAAADSPAAEEH